MYISTLKLNDVQNEHNVHHVHYGSASFKVTFDMSL